MDYDPLLVRETAFVRLARAMGLLRVEEPTREASPGADFAEGVPAQPGYDQRRAMSALVASPFYTACVQAKATDLAGLPIVVARKVRRKGAVVFEPLDSHPLIDLLDAPTSDPTYTGRMWRAQWFTDRLCAGTAGALIGWHNGRPKTLQRMHPARIDLEPSRTGGVRSIGYARNLGESAQSYDPSTVLLWRNISWQDDPTELFGLGMTQVLDADISAEHALARNTERSARKGRPDAVYRPMSADVVWGRDQLRNMKVEVANLMKSSDGGVAVLSGSGQLEPLGWSPQDMASSEQRHEVRIAVMALLGVPPIRLGLETANYATAREQLQVYWSTLQADAMGFDEQLQRLADKYDEDLVVYHDFSGVEALQESIDAKLARVERHIRNGMSMAQAYAYEGFDDVVVEEEQPPEPEAKAAPMDTEAVADIIAQAQALRSGDVEGGEVAIEAQTLADMVLQLLGGLGQQAPAEAR